PLHAGNGAASEPHSSNTVIPGPMSGLPLRESGFSGGSELRAPHNLAMKRSRQRGEVDGITTESNLLVAVDKLHVGAHTIGVASQHMQEVPYGTLDLLILKSLDSMGSMHGYRLARRIEQVAGNLIQLNQGSIYPALIRLENRGWIGT